MARELGIPAYRLMREMSPREFGEWIAYYRLEREDELKANAEGRAAANLKRPLSGRRK